jgi:hypothetical protein
LGRITIAYSRARNFSGGKRRKEEKLRLEIVQTLQWSVLIWCDDCVMQTITINLGSVLSSKFKMRQFLNSVSSQIKQQ